MALDPLFTAGTDPAENKYAIHEACREGKFSIVESLLRTTPRLASLPDLDGRLPIHWATSFNHRAIVDLLLEYLDKPVKEGGWEIDVQDGMGWTPLMIACSVREGEELVEVFVGRGAGVGVKNYNGQEPLHLCASKSHLHTARFLIAHGATPRTKDTRQQQTPLHRAAAVGSIPLIKLFLEHKAPINATDRNGYTALHHAVAEGHGEAAMVLLREGAQGGKVDGEGKRALELAPDGKVASWIRAQCANEGIEI